MRSNNALARRDLLRDLSNVSATRASSITNTNKNSAAQIQDSLTIMTNRLPLTVKNGRPPRLMSAHHARDRHKETASKFMIKETPEIGFEKTKYAKVNSMRRGTNSDMSTIRSKKNSIRG
jgi:hypothetical protein